MTPAPADASQTQFSELSDKEIAWIEEALDKGAAFVGAYSPDDADQPLTLAALDRAWAAWLASDPTDGEFINGIIDCIGAAFGQLLVDCQGLEWVIATDEAGVELAVRGAPEQGSVLVYPQDFVAKRWQERVGPFLEASYNDTADLIQSFSPPAVEHAVKKPWWKVWW